ncbi:MAG: hypothetical protein PVG53_04980 [Holophagae bacterium]
MGRSPFGILEPRKQSPLPSGIQAGEKVTSSQVVYEGHCIDS